MTCVGFRVPSGHEWRLNAEDVPRRGDGDEQCIVCGVPSISGRILDRIRQVVRKPASDVFMTHLQPNPSWFFSGSLVSEPHVFSLTLKLRGSV